MVIMVSLAVVIASSSTTLFQQNSQKETVQAATARVEPVYNWQKDEALQKRISIDSKCISLTALCDRIYEDTGVRLTTDTAHRNQKVQIFLKDRALVEVMTSLSELYGGKWIKKNNSFQFESDPEVLRKKVSWWYAFEVERKKVLGDVPRQLKNAMNNRKPDWKILQGASGTDLVMTENGLHQMQFCYDLPPAIQDSICESISDNYSYARHKFALPIIAEGGAVWSLSSLSELSTTSLLHLLRQTNPDVSRSQIKNFFIKNGASSLFVNVTVTGLGSDAKQVATGSTGLSLQYPNRQNTSVLGLDHGDLKQTLAAREQKPSLYQQRLINFQEQSFWTNNLTKSDKSIGPKNNFTGAMIAKRDGSLSLSTADIMRDSVLPRLPDMLGKLTPKVEFIADYYSIPYRPLTTQEWDAKVKDNVEEDLNDLAKEYDCSWKRQSENLFLIRNNRWYREDNLEVPLQIADELETLSQQAKRVSFPNEESAEMYRILEMASVASARLSKWQIASGLYYLVREERVPQFNKLGVTSQQNDSLRYRKSDCQPYTGVALIALLYNKTCRFYASLDYRKRADLVTTGVRIDDLSKLQQDLLTAASPEAASMSRESLVSFTARKITASISTPYLYGSKNEGAIPFKIDFYYSNDNSNE